MPDITIDLGATGQDAPQPSEKTILYAGRYRDEGPLGAGGMGEVRRVFDTVLERQVAIKLIRWVMLEKPDARVRFFQEARLTARLHHPGIVSVYDVGELADGRLWYTMPEVEGATFTQAILALHATSRPVPARWRGWNRHRLLTALHRACAAVAYAHSHDIVHRDLKPDNMMIGAFDEVLVLDWGIAAVQRLLADQPLQRIGTPAYMPPEQATGAAVLASDVYALGASLHSILTGELPWALSSSALRGHLRSGRRPPLRTADANVPPALWALFASAVQEDPRDRPTAAAFAGALQDWLDGSVRRRRALSVLQEARSLTPQIEQLRAEVGTLRAQARETLAGVRPHDPLSDKAAAWALEDRVADTERQIAHAETLYIHTLHSALNHDPSLTEAHAQLAEAYHAQMVAAERHGDAELLARLEVFLRAHDRGQYADFIDGTGTLSLDTTPSGARATLLRYTVQQRRLALTPHGPPRQTPIQALRLPAGSYLVQLEADGHEPARYPIWIGRGRPWSATPPGAAVPRPIRLLASGALGPDEVLVPAGWFRAGGDSAAIDSLPHRWCWVDDLVVQRRPVTNRAYIAWLDALWASGRREAALRHQPRSRHTERAYRQASDGTFHPAEDTESWSLDAPVVLVDWHAAAAYAADHAAATGQPWRLLHDHEWEKAARGVDGRSFPWGEHFDPRRTSMARSEAGRPRRRVVGALADDESPYGILDMAGNIREWCANPYRHDGPATAQITDADHTDGDQRYRMSRGGAWSSSNHTFCRLGSRFAGAPELRLVSLGFRLARSV